MHPAGVETLSGSPVTGVQDRVTRVQLGLQELPACIIDKTDYGRSTRIELWSLPGFPKINRVRKIGRNLTGFSVNSYDVSFAKIQWFKPQRTRCTTGGAGSVILFPLCAAISEPCMVEIVGGSGMILTKNNM